MTTMRWSPSPPRTLHRTRLVFPALAVALVMAFVAPVQAGAAGNDAADYVARINALRSSVGVGTLQVDGQLSAAAQGWADHMASTGVLEHAPDLSAGLSSNWSKLGENVGVGPNNAVLWSAFVASAHHYENLVDPAFNYVGVGVAYGGGRQWTCHRFMQVGAGYQRPAPPPASRPTPRAPAAQPPPSPVSVVAPPPPPPPPSGPPPPADSTRVAAVLSALHQLSN